MKIIAVLVPNSSHYHLQNSIAQGVFLATAYHQH
jgi:hypothetical protein